MAQELAGKVAIITGGAAGIGRATVELFVAEGACVVIADLQEERGQNLAAELGERACFQRTDVADANSVQAVVDCAATTFGGLHIMFNNAGVSGGQGAAQYIDNDLAHFDTVMSVDLLGPMLGARAAAAHMVDHGGGVILNTASIAGSYSGFGVPEYRAAKAGVIALSQSLAVEFGAHGIRVNSISPGPIQTEIVGMGTEMPDALRDGIIEASMNVMLDMQVLHRIGQPRDVAEAALFLASDRAAQITGIDLVVDGGASLGDRINRQAEMAQAIVALQQPGE